MNAPKLSIIVPTLNEERVIERTLQNLRTIHSIPHEIIVADSNSKDDTREIAAKYVDAVVMYQGAKKPNAAIGRNLGATAAHGDIFLFQDADVILADADHFVAYACEVLEKNPGLVALTAAARIEPGAETWADRIMYWIINRTFVLLNVFRIGGASGECQIIRREAFEKIGGYNESLPIGEDNEIFQKLARIGRTRICMELLTLQTGRRQHAVGWPRLLWQWISSWFTMTFFRTSAAGTWEEIR